VIRTRVIVGKRGGRKGREGKREKKIHFSVGGIRSTAEWQNNTRSKGGDRDFSEGGQGGRRPSFRVNKPGRYESMLGRRGLSVPGRRWGNMQGHR